LPPADEELEGTTLRVYLYVVREDKPVGPRDVMRGTNLSSPSVAYRHLQKLETLGLIQRDNYGEYTVKEKANIKGHLWIGKNLIPRLIIYSFFFIGILTAEIATITLRLTTDQPISTEHIILTLTTTTATILFLTEGVILHLKTKTA
jgi:hypothetical protein